MTVSGFTITRASRQRGHTRDNATQKQAVGHAEGGPGRFPLRDSQLLAQSKVLQMQRRAAEESLTDHGKDDLKGGLHIGDAKRHRSEMLGFPRRIGFIGATAGCYTKER